MRTLSEHIYDLIQNSIVAGARNIQLIVREDTSANTFEIQIIDDGHGLTTEQIKKVTDTFYTTRSRKKRRVGLGLPLMEATCRRSGGELTIESKHRHGTTITATMEHDHIDRPPIGDFADMLTSLLMSSTENKVMWKLAHSVDGREYTITNRKILDEINAISFSDAGIRKEVLGYIAEKEKAIRPG